MQQTATPTQESNNEPYGSIDYYAAMLASFAGPGEEKWFHGLTVQLVENALADGYSNADRVRCARNVIAAAKRVLAEREAAGQ